MRFIKANVRMQKQNADPFLIPATINLGHVASVLTLDGGDRCSVLLSTGDRLTVEMPFREFQAFLLEHGS